MWFAFAAAGPDKQLVVSAEKIGPVEVSEAALATPASQSIETTVVTPSVLPPPAIKHQQSGDRSDPQPAITPAVTTTAAAPSELPEYLRNCFFAEEELCLNWHQQQQPNVTGQDSAVEHFDAPAGNIAQQLEAGEASAASNSAENINVSNAQNGSQLQGQNRDRDANSCQCREHPTRPNSWYCCNITHISMVSSCSNISKWINLHIRNLTVQEMDVSNPTYRSLQSLAVTDGNITSVTHSFPRHSKIKCLDMSNNNISEIETRAVKDLPHLEYLGLANNHLSRVPNRNKNKNIALDIR